MNKKAQLDFMEIVLIFIISIIVSLVAVGMYYSLSSNDMCEKSCYKIGGDIHKIVPNREWFNTDDICSCYFNNGILINFNNLNKMEVKK